MSTVLQQQLDTYSRSVAGANGGAARDERLAGDLIDVGLRLYEATKEAVRRWHADIGRGAASYNTGEAEQFMALYRALDQAFDRVAPVVDQAVTAGGVVEGAERFGRERMYLKATLCATPDKADRAARQLAAGQVKPAAEVKRELLRRLQT